MPKVRRGSKKKSKELTERTSYRTLTGAYSMSGAQMPTILSATALPRSRLSKPRKFSRPRDSDSLSVISWRRRQLDPRYMNIDENVRKARERVREHEKIRRMQENYTARISFPNRKYGRGKLVKKKKSPERQLPPLKKRKKKSIYEKLP